MNHQISIKKLLHVVSTTLVLACFTNTCIAVDADAAKALARKNSCLRCHGIDKEKDGPSFVSVAAKYRGKANAEARLIAQITTGEKVKFPDGHEEHHKIIKTGDMGEIRNLVNWILSN